MVKGTLHHENKEQKDPYAKRIPVYIASIVRAQRMRWALMGIACVTTAPGVLGASCTSQLPAPAPLDALHSTPIVVGRGFDGAVEEIYLKNTSTEHRVGYM